MIDLSSTRQLQPVGVFPLPFGYLLLPEHHSAAPVRAALLNGRLPKRWPPMLRGHELALRGEFSDALAAFAGDDPVNRFNRFVIERDGVDPDRLRDDLCELGALVDLVQFTVGRSDALPETTAQAGEIAALVLAAQAAVAANGGHLDAAINYLEIAIARAPTDYPVLAGVLYGALGHVHRLTGALGPTVIAFERGIELLAGTDLAVARAEQFLELGTAYHEQAGDRRDLLIKAVHHYHSATQAVTEHQAPELFAAAHANLGSAYLTMPMVEASDQLRQGVAVGSLRAALRFYTRDTHPQEWASVQLNLANALVYAPSTHQGDNLVEAVERYEEVLAARDRHGDPVGYARVLANQGNALAHLGLFDHARGKLVEARFLFEEFHEYDAVTSVRGVLDEITRQRGRSGADNRSATERRPA